MDQSIEELQSILLEQGLSGWLLYDFSGSNPLARQFLGIAASLHTTRRLFYWLPVVGDPVKVVHRIESFPLDHLPGVKVAYTTWQELAERLGSFFSPGDKVAMEYSPMAAIPTVSLVDGGIIDLIRNFGVEVKSSAELLQRTTATLSCVQMASHREAINILDDAVASAWKLIAESLRSRSPLTEYDVQQHIMQYFADRGVITSSPPICAVNSHSADPHYMPTREGSAVIEEGDFILIDLWCKLDREGAIYGDITRVAVAAREATERQKRLFSIVKEASDRAIALVEERFAKKCRIEGWEVDCAARDIIIHHGYGDYFIHRTGHSIGTETHGAGANMDNFETHDNREIVHASCFSIEPGIYLPGEFGVRLECDVVVDEEGRVEVTGGRQEEILCLLC